jgi:hypothetical protein
MINHHHHRRFKTTCPPRRKKSRKTPATLALTHLSHSNTTRLILMVFRGNKYRMSTHIFRRRPTWTETSNCEREVRGSLQCRNVQRGDRRDAYGELLIGETQGCRCGICGAEGRFAIRRNRWSTSSGMSQLHRGRTHR